MWPGDLKSITRGLAMGLTAIFLLLPSSLSPGATVKIWQRICEQLIADDPLQFADLTPKELVRVHINFKAQDHHSKVLIDEMELRLLGDLSPEDRELLVDALEHEPQVDKSL